MRTRAVTFPGALGHELSGRLELPAGDEPIACALFAHCFTCSMDLKAAVNVARALAAQRIAVLRFDFTGLGRSEGDFGDTTYSSNVDDLIAAAGFLEEQLQAPSILVGHSLGGAAVLHAARRLPSVRAVATIGAPGEPSHVLRHLESSREEIEQEGEAVVRLAGRPFRIGRAFLEDLEAPRLEGAARDLGRALLIFHSPIDPIVGIENAARLYQAARHPKSFVSLDQADHLLTDEADARYVGAVLAAWAQKYVDLPPEPPPEEVVKSDRVVTTTAGDAFRTEVLAGGHALVADEPRSVGGQDTGPTPYELLAAALGACTGMTLKMYAERKGWPLEEVVVHLRHDKIYAEDEARCEDEPARLDRLTRILEIEGPLEDAQRARLVEIAGRCPVHRTLEAGVQVETTLAEGDDGWPPEGGEDVPR